MDGCHHCSALARAQNLFGHSRQHAAAAAAAAPPNGGVCNGKQYVHHGSVWTRTHTYTCGRVKNTAGGIPVAASVCVCLCVCTSLCVQTRKQICTFPHAASLAGDQRCCTCANISTRCSAHTMFLFCCCWSVRFCSVFPFLRPSRQQKQHTHNKCVQRCMHVDNDGTFRSDLGSGKRAHVHTTRQAWSSDSRASHNGYYIGIL